MAGWLRRGEGADQGVGLRDHGQALAQLPAGGCQRSDAKRHKIRPSGHRRDGGEAQEDQGGEPRGRHHGDHRRPVFNGLRHPRPQQIPAGHQEVQRRDAAGLRARLRLHGRQRTRNVGAARAQGPQQRHIHGDGVEVPVDQHRVRGVRRPERCGVPQDLLQRLHVHERHQPHASSHVAGQPADPQIGARKAEEKAGDGELPLHEGEAGRQGPHHLRQPLPHLALESGQRDRLQACVEDDDGRR